ncbi:MAG TPA: GGDEF domain-containing protein [Polyangiaceae bacterium]
MFWRSGSTKTPRPEPPPVSRGRTSGAPESPEVELEIAVETLASVFRAVGRFAFDLPDLDAARTADLCERWAAHLLLRTAPPDLDPGNLPAAEAEDSAPISRGRRGADGRREFSAALRYVTALRRSEHTHIVKSLTDLRQIVWAFVRSLNQTLVAEGDSDVRVKEQLVRLQAAARSSSTEDLRREAFAVVDVVSLVAEQRRQRQTAHANDLGARVRALGEALEEARREGALDPLTRLSNRRTFDEELERTVDVSIFGRRMGLLLVDIDHFKNINDAHGHVVGDEVIRAVSGCLVRTFRHRDDVVARYGGEEFAVILRDTEPKNARMLTDRLLEAVRNTRIPVGDDDVSCTVSAGLTELLPAESSNAWVERTDKALYQAKRDGRNRIVVAA